MLFILRECLVEVVAEFVVVAPPNVAGGGHDFFQTIPEVRALLNWKGPRFYGVVTGPRDPREFIFSPEVGRTIDGPQATQAIGPQDVIAVQRFGRGTFNIERFEVSHDEKGCPRLSRLEFNVRLEGGYGNTGSSGRPE